GLPPQGRRARLRPRRHRTPSALARPSPRPLLVPRNSPDDYIGSPRRGRDGSMNGMTSAAPSPKLHDRNAALALLRWDVEIGADEAIAAEPANRLAPSPAAAVPTPSAAPPPQAAPAVAAAPPKALTESLAEAAQSARRLAAGAETVAALA